MPAGLARKCFACRQQLQTSVYYTIVFVYSCIYLGIYVFICESQIPTKIQTHRDTQTTIPIQSLSSLWCSNGRASVLVFKYKYTLTHKEHEEDGKEKSTHAQTTLLLLLLPSIHNIKSSVKAPTPRPPPALTNCSHISFAECVHISLYTNIQHTHAFTYGTFANVRGSMCKCNMHTILRVHDAWKHGLNYANHSGPPRRRRHAMLCAIETHS